MSSDWKSVKLAEVMEIVGGGTPKTTNAAYWNGNIPWLSVVDFNGVPRWVEKTEKHITQRGLEESSTKLLNAGDIIISARGTVGALAQLKHPMTFNQSCYGIRGKEGVCDTDFLFYALKVAVEELKRHAHGGVFDTITRDTFNTVDMLLPAMNVQKKIAKVLGDIDQQITLLQKTNETLHKIAKSIFKSWFIDFDPVHAKANGNAPQGVTDDIASYFPSSFVNTDIGQIPSGWNVQQVSNIVSIVKGKSYSSKDLVDQHTTALVTLKSFERGGGFRMDGFKPYCGTYKEEQVVSSGDLIVAYTDVTQAAELIGKPAIVVGVNEYKKLVASLDVGIIRPVDKLTNKQFLYGLFSTAAFQAHTLAHTTGTTVLHLAKDAIGSYTFANPPTALHKAYDEISSPIAHAIQTNIDRGRTLSILRDTLLPRLISGQLDINCTEIENITV